MSNPDWRLDWPVSQGGRVGRAHLKALPEHFFVDEILGFPGFPEGRADISTVIQISGDGEHLCLRLEKCGDNTDYVARELARLSGCRPHDIGLCGLKDRHAVTRQWFSVYRPGMTATDEAFIAQVSLQWPVLRAHRFARKLRRGEHQVNRFVITLTGVEGDQLKLDRALQTLQAVGCPNYFGAQRFGKGGNNLEQAIRMKPGRQRGKNSRDGLYFSAARSWLFNEVLAERVALGLWSSPMAGEPVVDGITGPLWGDGGTVATDLQGKLERAVVARHPEIAAVFSRTRMKPERRPLVLRPSGFEWRWDTVEQLTLSFALAPGQYATTLLDDLFHVLDASASSRLAATP